MTHRQCETLGYRALGSNGDVDVQHFSWEFLTWLSSCGMPSRVRWITKLPNCRNFHDPDALKLALRAKLQKPTQKVHATHQTRHSKRPTNTPQVRSLHDCPWVYLVLCTLGLLYRGTWAPKKVLFAEDPSVRLFTSDKRQVERAE